MILGVDPRTQSLVRSLGHAADEECGASPIGVKIRGISFVG